MNSERAVIGGIILSAGKRLDDLTLSGDDFYEPTLGNIFDTARKLWADRKPVDTITLSAALPKLTVLISELQLEVPTAANVEYYAQLVSDAAVKRRLSEAATGIIQKANDWDVPDLVDYARKVVDEASGLVKSKVTFMHDEIVEMVDRFGDQSQIFPTPWSKLNDLIGGLRPGALYVVGARPGVGKSVIALQIAMRMIRFGAVAFSSLEMSRLELHKRALSASLAIPLHRFDSGLTERDFGVIGNFRNQPLPVAFDDRSGVTVQDIKVHARNVKRTGSLSCVVVDYLQLITTPGKEPRHEKVADISRQLKILANDLEVPVVALSQLNRASTSRSDSKPALSDLRESGAIEQDADVVILLHREPTVELADLEMAVMKNRHGSTGHFELAWEGQFVRALDK